MRPSLPLGRDDHFIRLLNLDHVNGHSLTVHPLKTAPPFCALSYCWGEQKPSRRLICDGSAILITPSLHEALEQIYRLGFKVLWADQICIDQENIGEKNHQVGFMGDIYSTASAALIWLGAATAEDKAIADHMRRWSAFFEENKLALEETGRKPTKYEGPDLAALKKHGSQEPFIRILSRPWFTRAWVVQEYALAQDSFVIQGETLLDLLHLFRAFVSLYRTSNSSELTQRQWLEIRQFLQLIRFRMAVFNNKTVGLFEMYNSHRNKVCRDGRDHIFSLLTIFKKDSTFLMEPDYNANLEEVYLNFASALVTSSNKLDMLCFLRPSDAEELNIPSWVPNFSPTMESPALHNTPRSRKLVYSWSASSESAGSLSYRLDGQVLGLNGHHFDFVEAKSCHMPKAAHIRDKLQGEVEEQARSEVALLAAETISQASKSQIKICILQNVFEQMLLFGGATELSEVHEVYEIFYRLVSEDPSILARGLSPYNLVNMIQTLNLDSSLIMARTRGGNYCWVPWDTELGDEIVLCAGSRFPLAIRRLNPDEEPPRYHMLGGCYVHGIMFGEARRPEDLREMRFV